MMKQAEAMPTKVGTKVRSVPHGRIAPAAVKPRLAHTALSMPSVRVSRELDRGRPRLTCQAAFRGFRMP